MTKIVLDAESFKALASDTRLLILKALDARPLTVSELSRLLDLNKATVFEHLKQLSAAELAKREEDPARKWVYYKLSWKGRNVLHPENAQIFIMLGVAALSFGGAILQTARILRLVYEARTRTPTSAAPELSPSGSAETHPNPQAAMAAQSSSTSAASGSAAAGGGSQADKSAADRHLDSGVAAPQQPVQGAPGHPHHWYDALQSSDLGIVLAIVILLILLAMLVQALYSGQKRERQEILRRIDLLPSDVNAAEERGV
jgi:DNA-binding transcriptional ArsR family regulator